MAKNYVISFGQSAITGLAPTFTIFKNMAGTNATAPGITQIPTTSGLYYFTYGPTNTIAFMIDGATTGLGGARFIPGSLDPIDAVDEQLTAVGNTLNAYGATNVAIGTSHIAQGVTLGFGQSNIAIGITNIASGVTGIGNTLLALGGSLQFGFSSVYSLIGTTASSFGDSTTSPSTLFGYLKRLREFDEGDSTFDKTSGIWDVFNRATITGTTTLLVEKTLTDTADTVTKS